MTAAPADLYDDGSEPKVEKAAVQFKVRVPGHEVTHWALVSVETDSGYCELASWRWDDLRSKRGGYRLTDPDDAARWEAMSEVWEWLREWELVELRPVGPEDSEHFATAKLTKLVRS